MVYDTKVYTKIYNNTIFNFLKKTKENDSKKIARTEMAKDIVGVLEGYVNYYIGTIISIFGSISFIYISNWRIGILVSLALIFKIVAVLIYYKKIRQSINLRNDHHENKVKSIQRGYHSSVSFFKRKRKLDIFESTLQGKNWFLFRSLKMLFLVSSIIILILTSKNITAGEVVTLYSYVNNFLSSLSSIPVAFEMYSRLSNIITRID